MDFMQKSSCVLHIYKSFCAIIRLEHKVSLCFLIIEILKMGH